MLLFCLCKDNGSSSEQSDSQISPLRPVRPKIRFTEALPPNDMVCPNPDNSMLYGSKDNLSGRKEYQMAMQSLGSAKSRLLSQSLSEPAFSSTPALSANQVSALVAEEDYIADDWLDDDLGSAQPKKKRRVDAEQGNRQDSLTVCKSQIRTSGSAEPSNRGVETIT